MALAALAYTDAVTGASFARTGAVAAYTPDTPPCNRASSDIWVWLDAASATSRRDSTCFCGCTRRRLF